MFYCVFIIFFVSLICAQVSTVQLDALRSVCIGLNITDCRCGTSIIACSATDVVSIGIYGRVANEGFVATQIGRLSNLQTLNIIASSSQSASLVGTLPSGSQPFFANGQQLQCSNPDGSFDFRSNFLEKKSDC
jgi:hypothetical protein